jgi:tetratricopeptide (TPR) repeat protein
MFRQQSATRQLVGDSGSSQQANDGLTLRFASNKTIFVGGRWLRAPEADTADLHPASGDGGGDPVWMATAEMPQGSLALAQYSPRAGNSSEPISANAPHSLASDAWKGLIFSLTAGNHNTEALQELAKVPPDVRRQLEADIEFVQGIASLYVVVGDTTHAMEYLNRVENFYLLHRSSAPAGLEIQHAWLLYNLNDDVGLYPVLQRLDVRQNLTSAQREQVETLWADWAVRRAATAMENGNMLRGVELLQAASQDYPDNLNVRRAVAGAYARVGRAADALTLFKTIPMQDASPGDYQGAISAAMGATDMAQAEAWLRHALARYPNDPLVLGLAARFEQARGSNERAADFWRAALALLPPGSTVKSLDSGLAFPPGSYHAPVPGEMKHLLDPRNDPLPQSSKLPPLPAYKSNTAIQAPATGTSVPPTEPAPQQKWLNTPSNNPLPLNSTPAATPTTVPNAQGTMPANAPAYIPQSIGQGVAPGQPVLIEQSMTAEPQYNPAISTTQNGRPVRRKARKKASQPSYTGTMNLPPSEQNVDSTGQEPISAPAENLQPAPLWTPGLASQDSSPRTGLRITSQPMGSLAAQTQAMFAEQTDSQLTQGYATAFHPSMAQNPSPSATPSASGQYAAVQYTPSAQEAATGAYSAPRQQGVSQPSAEPEQAPAAKPSAAQSTTVRRKHKRAASQTLNNAPTTRSTQELPSTESAQQAETPAYTQEQQPSSTSTSTGAGLTDEELQQRNLPPLRGPWVRVQREAHPISPREEAETQLRAIESGYSAWLGGTGLLNYRSGALGYDHLAALEAPFEASLPMGYHGRLTIVAKPVFLDSGQADGTATTSVLEFPTTGATYTSIAEPIGTLTASDTTPPAQQNAVGLGGEVQLAFPHLAIAGGYTPAGFLVATFIARAAWRPGNGPFTFSFNRDSVKDTQLSYAGLRDPKENTLGNEGQIWGGVIANQGNLQYSRGDAQSGFYFGAGGQYLTGYHVQQNTRIDGSGGAYWRLLTSPEYGNLSIGVNFFAMHYEHNESAFTHGMGGYFSPQGYFLANVPFTFVGHYLTNWHYNITGGMGVQAFQENKTELWPLAVDKSLETSENNPMLPDMTSVGPNYDLRGQVAYQISPHWFAGGYFGANNTRNYSSAQAGFFVRYMFRAQPSTVAGPTGIFPTEGLRPFTVP